MFLHDSIKKQRKRENKNLNQIIVSFYHNNLPSYFILIKKKIIEFRNMHKHNNYI